MVRDSFFEDREPKSNIISRIFCMALLAVSAYFIINLSFAGLLPTKYFFLIFIVLIILNLIFILCAFRRRTSKKTLVVFNILSVALSVAMIFSSVKINEVSNFINDNFSNTKKYAVYDVIVSNKSDINSLEDLSGSELFTYEEPVKEVENKRLEESVKNVINDSTLVFKDDLDIVMNRIVDLTGTASVVNNGTFESYISVNEDYEAKIRIVGEIKVEILGEVSEDEEIKSNPITTTPFVMYISGIDTRTNAMPTRSLSDVNIIAAVNPKTKKMTFINIPRDSYVLIHGDSGLKDKLTHAGSRGGIELSKATLEDLLGAKIDRYVRVNFNFVSDLVDKIGGINVTSSESKPFKTAVNGCTINPGVNFVDGRCALGFVRERKTLKDGDRQRGKNQIQVIETVFNKVIHDKSIIANYSVILDSLNGSFETSLTSSEITALIRMQIDDMAEWKTETYAINGSGAMDLTHSYPNQKLYVMKIDQKTLDTAKEKIKATLK